MIRLNEGSVQMFSHMLLVASSVVHVFGDIGVYMQMLPPVCRGQKQLYVRYLYMCTQTSQQFLNRLNYFYHNICHMLCNHRCFDS